MIFALADVSDPNHVRAIALFKSALDSGEPLLVHDYIIVEATALLQRRLGADAALQFLSDSTAFQIHWLTAEDHQEAVDLLRLRRRRDLSLVDCASFVIMHRYAISEALAFDADFEREGFALAA